MHLCVIHPPPTAFIKELLDFDYSLQHQSPYTPVVQMIPPPALPGSASTGVDLPVQTRLLRYGCYRGGSVRLWLVVGLYFLAVVVIVVMG
ncbi:hypothetical protein BDW42DRAFT_173146 [Aspergillus taichungensis]|uniref:Uncharacterized protein n=1 Tax=Aspergillus taichungensis TaxID=482145 RepID=A0A2J5HPY8_9EURO|nr:hypothetical protein BDW42DRAFT_173146 [Aspergillus taichungensis]